MFQSDTAKAADSVADVDAVGGLQVIKGEILFFDVGEGFEQVSAVDAGKDAAIERRRVPAGGFLDKEIADGALGDFVASVEKKNVSEACGRCGCEGGVVESAVGGLVEEEPVGRVGAPGSEADRNWVAIGDAEKSFGFDVGCAPGVKEQPHFALVRGGECRGRKEQ